MPATRSQTKSRPRTPDPPTPPPAKKRYVLLDSPKKNQLVGAAQVTRTIRGAARLMDDVPKSTAADIMKKWTDTGSTHRRPGSGRPKKVTPDVERTVLKLAVENRRMGYPEIGRSLTPPIHKSTVRRIALEHGYHRRKARTVVFLKLGQKAKRMDWAKEFEKWTREDWARVIWSDECYVVLGDAQHNIYVTRRPGEEWEESCVVPKFKQSGLRVMVWACIIEGRKGPLVILEYPGGRGGGMTAERYQKQVLDKAVSDFYQEMSEERGQVRFQQDGAPSHSAKSTRSWLDINEIETMPHPASSPDIPPIEPVWHDFKQHIRRREHPPTSLDELKQACLEAWDVLSVEDINKHIRRMEDRVQALLKAKGGHTRF